MRHLYRDCFGAGRQVRVSGGFVYLVATDLTKFLLTQMSRRIIDALKLQ